MKSENKSSKQKTSQQRMINIAIEMIENDDNACKKMKTWNVHMCRPGQGCDHSAKDRFEPDFAMIKKFKSEGLFTHCGFQILKVCKSTEVNARRNTTVRTTNHASICCITTIDRQRGIPIGKLVLMPLARVGFRKAEYRETWLCELGVHFSLFHAHRFCHKSSV